MKVKSNFFKREFDVDIFDKEENGRLIQVIKHDSLRDVYLNQLKGVKATYHPVVSNIEHSVVMCNITDSQGRSITEVGESLTETLTDDIARNYPTLTAFQRAFDRAMIAYLDLEGKVLSNLELGLNDLLDASVSNNDESSISEEIVSKEEKSDFLDNPILNIEEEIIEEDTLEMNAPIVEEVIIEESDNKEINYEDEIIAWGQYKNSPKRAGDIVVAGNESWLEWVIYKLTPANKEATRVKEILRKVNEVKKIV